MLSIQAAAVYFNDDVKPNEAAPYLEPVGVYSKLKPQNEDYEELGLLDERHLLEFARQIAAGMVNTANHDIHIELNSCSFSFKMTIGKVV